MYCYVYRERNGYYGGCKWQCTFCDASPVLLYFDSHAGAVLGASSTAI